MIPVIGRRIRRLDGHCAACDCLTSETAEALKEPPVPIECWNYGSTNLDFRYCDRKNLSFYQGALLSEILSGDRLSTIQEVEPTVEAIALPSEYEWMASLMGL